MVLAVGISGYYFYQHKQKEAKCVIDIVYLPMYENSGDYYSQYEGIANSRRFRTNEEGVDYCMSAKRIHFMGYGRSD